MRCSRDVWDEEMWCSCDVWDEEGLAGRNCAKCCVFPYCCGFAGSESQLLKTGGCGGPAAQDVAKICTTLWRESGLEVKIVKDWEDRTTFSSWASRAIWKSKSLKTGRFGTLLPKICTTLRRESDSDVKSMNNWHDRSTFWSWSLQKVHPAAAIWKSKSWKHQVLGALFEVQSAFCVAGTRISTQHPHKNHYNVLQFWGQVSGQHVIFQRCAAEKLQLVS